MKRWTILCCALLLTLLLSGCDVKFTLDPQELYRLPELPDKYTALNEQINAQLESGAEYAAPTSGSNIQPVQMVDLNGDGRQSAVAFFRNAGDEKPLKICIYSAAQDDSYNLDTIIEGSGTSIYSVAYSDLNGDGRMELLVGWRVSTELQALSVYALTPTGVEELLRTGYVRYTLADLNRDSHPELILLHADDEGEGVADYYVYQENGMVCQSTARISSTMAEISQQGRVVSGRLESQEPALFITGVTDVPRAVTDILTVRNGELVNISLSEATGLSHEVSVFCSLYPTDINGDGVTEVPNPARLSAWSEDGMAYQRIDWKSYDASGVSHDAQSTYHDLENGWYFRLPERWVHQLMIERSTSMVENSVTFYTREGNGQQAGPFLRITAITGSSRENRATRGGRFLLARLPEVIYVAELLDDGDGWAGQVTQDQVREAFSLIYTDWTTGYY